MSFTTSATEESQSKQQAQRWEQLITEACQAQPMLIAPSELQIKVMAEVRRRATLSWWRKPFSYWPASARVALIMVSSGVAWLSLWVLGQLQTHHYATQLVDSIAKPVALLRSITQLISLLDYIVTLLMTRIPDVWWYGGVLSVAVGYAAMLSLGAVVYRGCYPRLGK